jgi:pyruvate/2-oxoglutarate dehydrogenase complex dihydrolipoamide dehydrogenase (E3) component
VTDDVYERERLEYLRPPDWTNPTPSGRYHLVVIGAGAAGIAAATTAAASGAKVALIERNLLGGTCLNVGCVPSKAIIRSSRAFAEMRTAARYGARHPDGGACDVDVDFVAVMDRMRRLRTWVSRGFDVQQLTAAGIDVFFGDAKFANSKSVKVRGATLRFKKALIATGSRADVPLIPGLNRAGYLTNETVFDLTALPKRLLVIGGGPLGCELAQAFCRFGAKTIIVQDLPLFLPKEERDAAQLLADAFTHDGLEVRLNTTVTHVRIKADAMIADLISADYKSRVTVDAVLTGVGRLPNVEDMNLEAAGVDFDPTAGVRVDDFLRTTNHRIYAAGDVCLEHKYTHVAEATARMAVDNALFLGRQRLSALTVPWCTFTDPEIAHVGLSVREAAEKGIPVKTFTVMLHEMSRAVVDGEDVGFVKIHVRDGTDRILGATIVARHAGEMISEITTAIVAGVGMRALSRIIHASPVQAGAIKAAADAFCNAQVTPPIKARLRRWLTR